MAPVRFVLRDLILALGGLCALAAVAAQGGRWNERLDVLTHFAPVYLAGAVLALVCAAVTPSGAPKLLLALAGAIAAAGSLSLMAPEALRAEPPQLPAGAPGQIKIVQFNVSPRAPGFQQSLDWIVAQDPDVLFVEESSPGARMEIVRRMPRHVSVSQGDETAIFTRTAPEAVERPGKGRYGAGPNTVIARMSARDGGYVLVGTRYTWPVYLRPYRWAMARMRQVLGPYPRERMILAGDFNSTPWSFARRREDVGLGLERRTRALPSWPALAPFLPIDHVYAGPGLRTVSVTRGPNLGSDHRPIVAILAPAS